MSETYRSAMSAIIAGCYRDRVRFAAFFTVLSVVQVALVIWMVSLGCWLAAGIYVAGAIPPIVFGISGWRSATEQIRRFEEKVR